MAAPIRLCVLTGTPADLTERAENLQWSSINPGGDEQCSFTVDRDWARSAPELRQGNVIQVTAGLDVLWRGRIEEADRSVADRQQVGITAFGLGTALKDVQDYVDVIVDQDMTAWGDMPLAEKIALTND